MKKFAISVCAVTMFVLGVIYFSSATYIDERITSGSWMGIAIGQTKDEVYKKMPALLGKLDFDGVYFVYLDEGGDIIGSADPLLRTKILVQAVFDDDSYDYFLRRQVWTVYLDGDFRNFVSFVFCGEILCELNRHRLYFELP